MQCNASVMHTFLSTAVAVYPFLSQSCSMCWAACEVVPDGPTWRHSHLMESTPVSRLDVWPEANKLDVAAALAVPCRSSREASVASTPWLFPALLWTACSRGKPLPCSEASLVEMLV